LWRLGLFWLYEAIGNSVHRTDQRRVIDVARGMRMAGETAPETDFYREVSTIWGRGSITAPMIKEKWRAVYRANTSRGKTSGEVFNPLYVPDLLIRMNQLVLDLEHRIAEVGSAPGLVDT